MVIKAPVRGSFSLQKKEAWYYALVLCTVRNTGEPDTFAALVCLIYIKNHMNTKTAQENPVEKSDVALREEAILSFWKEHDIFHKSLQKEAPKGEFIFYDGPPFATGLPHYGHILAGTIKDAIPRFWTMNGYHVPRKWGWDCHGLPIENLIEKKLGLATKRDIEEYGVKKFNEAARASVMEFADDWRQIIPRMGRWADMEHDYKTMDASYTESVWWVFAQLYRKGLVYEGFKSMHLCPRCGTTLSNFEVNQGYKDIKDIAVTVKLPLLDETGKVTDTSLLVWTTTPWTLPGNMAAAVHKDYDYVKLSIKKSESESQNNNEENGEMEYVILAKARLAQLGDMAYEIVEEMKGGQLVGKRYEPPFFYHCKRDFEGKENAWQILHADYVELGEEGIGAVHIAPAYGADDMELAQEHQVPIEHHVDESGRFMDFVTDFAGQLVKPKDDDEAGVMHIDADIEIVKALQANGKLFKKENVKHSYPHCWRCDTPLLNYATTSWFVEVTKIKDQLVAENRKVHWVPDHVGSARFGKWLEGARDWAVSRQRYWGAPLPIWRNPQTNEIKVFGTLAELQEYVPKSGNTYYVMRHGESTFNTQGLLNGSPDKNDENVLTEKGIQQTKDAAVQLSQQGGVDIIITSPLQRTYQTAQLLAEELGLNKDCVHIDERLLEMQFGEFEGKSVDEYHSFFQDGLERLRKRPEGGENWLDVKRRVGALLYELEKTFQDKRILLVSHNGTLQMLQAAAAGENEATTGRHIEDNSYDLTNAEVRALSFVPMPHNGDYELDFHRPYIDDITLYEDGVALKRVPDVFDCWFESGSMPYGQQHYTGIPLPSFDPEAGKGFPAQFIAEGLDQTRGWFYSLIVLGTALFGRSPYENVIVNGLVLAEDGKKMSKSLQNYPDPLELANRVGVDAMRLYLLSSPVIRGEDLAFSEKEVLELQRKNIGRLHNVLTMYQLFADESVSPSASSTQVLDRWIIARLHELIDQSTTGYKNYELDKATRPLHDFIDDLSVWYLRRSRDRLKGSDEEDVKRVLATLRYVLGELSKVMAPAMPFFAEYIFREIREESDPESVHLSSWPEGGDVDTALLLDMQKVRDIVSALLEARVQAGLKVRQPIASVSAPQLSEVLQQVVLDEVNAKQYIVSDSIAIDTHVTPELQAEGDMRELLRSVQSMRKKAGMQQHDRIILYVVTDDAGHKLVTQFSEEIQRVVGADDIVFMSDTDDREWQDIQAGTHTFQVALKRVI